MGSLIELNDTLQITDEQGFPAKVLNLDKHKKNPTKLQDVKDKIFEFHDKPGGRTARWGFVFKGSVWYIGQVWTS